MKYSESQKRYYMGDAEASAPEDAFDMTAEQVAQVMQDKKEGKTVRYENGVFVSYDPGSPPIDTLWARVRDERDFLLRQCDWTQMPDSPLASEQRAAWAAYRQALRDVPGVTVDPKTPLWPVKPE